MKIYVASSWRNDYQADVVHGLREAGHEVYDFKNPSSGGYGGQLEGLLDGGFHWSDIDPDWQQWSTEEYISNLGHPVAEAGFLSDFNAMQWADACVLVMPCGRSAHLEGGWFVGAGKPLLILADEAEPELMSKMADSIHIGLGPLMLRLEELEPTQEGAEC